MKKVSIFLLSIATLSSMLIVGCKKDSQVVTLGVQLESSASDSKLYIDTEYNPTFQEGDQVNVNGTNYDVTLSGSTYSHVSVAENTDGHYYAFFPTSLSTGFTGTSSQTVHLPRWQEYVVGTDGNQKVELPAAAVIEDGSSTLRFYNLCSLLEVQWTNSSSDSYDIIGIEVTVPGQALYGDGTATLSGTSSTLTLDDATKNRVNLDLSSAATQTVAANGVSPKYYVVLPAFTNKNVTVRIQTMKTTQSTADDQKVKTVTVSTTSAVTLPRNTIVPMHISATPTEDNSLTGYFSVSPTLKVVFSRGNLQHVGSNDPSTGTWKFADRQYDFYGGKNLTSTGYNITSTMDLFGWSEDETQHFGMHAYDYWNDLGDWGTGSFWDWGYHKTISNDPAQTWFTLTSDEWYYLLYQRIGNTGQALCGKAKITGIEGHLATQSSNTTATTDEVYGFILMPDDWTSEDVPSGLTFYPLNSSTSANSTTNEYTVSQWARMEAAGAMFLPAAGWGSNYHDEDNSSTDGSDIFNTYQEGHYWSATKKSGNYAESNFLAFKYQNAQWNLVTSSTTNMGNGSAFAANYDMQWWRMRSVRLVKPAPGYTDTRSIVNQTSSSK